MSDVQNNAASSALAALGLGAAAETPATPEVVSEPGVEPAVVAGADAAPVAAEGVVNTDATVTTEGTETTAGEAAAPVSEASKAPSFVAGGTADLSFDDIPATKRSGFTSKGGPSIYEIENIAAPGTDGKKYHGKLVEYKEGDVVAFKRSVQSSATSHNKEAKDNGTPNYYITRTAEVEGEFKGVYVIRTDERPVDDKEAAASAE